MSDTINLDNENKAREAAHAARVLALANSVKNQNPLYIKRTWADVVSESIKNGHPITSRVDSSMINALPGPGLTKVQINDLIDDLVDLRENLFPGEDPPPPPATNYYPLSRIDRNIANKPVVTAPGAAGSNWVDPNFGRRILRVTDSNTYPGQSWAVPSDSHLAAWSADSAKLFVRNGGGGTFIYDFDPVAFTATKRVNEPSSQCEPCFSRMDLNSLYTVGGAETRTVRKYNITANTYSDVVDIDTIVGGLVNPRTYIGCIEVSKTTPEKLVVLFGGTGIDVHKYILWKDLSGAIPNKLLNTQTRPGLGWYIHAISIDKSGRYVNIYPTNSVPYQWAVWDTTLDTITPVVLNPAGHGTVGFGVVINQDQGDLAYDACQWQIRSYTAPETTTDLITTVNTPQQVYLADHMNWNHALPDTMNPAISGTYRYNNNANAWRSWDDEIIGVSTDGTGTVYRFCHHQSDVSDNLNPAQAYFWYQPIVNVSPDGKYATFTSNWNKTLGADGSYNRFDVFLVELK